MPSDFSYLELLEALHAAQINFVIRLKLGSHPPQFFDENKRRIELVAEPGKTVIYRRIWYKGKVRVNLIGYWQPGYAEPLWVMTNLRAEVGGQIYFARMKIEETFRDLKSLLGLGKVMNQQQAKMEQLVALVLLAYTLGVVVGEELRDVLYGAPPPPAAAVRRSSMSLRHFQRPSQKWKLYSGLFLLLKQKLAVPQDQANQIVRTALDRFRQMVHHPVRTFV